MGMRDDEPHLDNLFGKRPLPYGIRWVWRAVRMAFLSIGGFGAVVFTVFITAIYWAITAPSDQPMTGGEFFGFVAVVLIGIGIVLLASFLLAPSRLEREFRRQARSAVETEVRRALAEAGPAQTVIYNINVASPADAVATAEGLMASPVMGPAQSTGATLTVTGPTVDIQTGLAAQEEGK